MTINLAIIQVTRTLWIQIYVMVLQTTKSNVVHPYKCQKRNLKSQLRNAWVNNPLSTIRWAETRKNPKSFISQKARFCEFLNEKNLSRGHLNIMLSFFDEKSGAGAFSREENHRVTVCTGPKKRSKYGPNELGTTSLDINLHPN